MTLRKAMFVLGFLACLVSTLIVVYGSNSSSNDIKTVTYIVSQHDTLWTIAEHFDPDANTQDVIAQIEQMNGLKDNDYLQVDQKLIVPVGK